MARGLVARAAIAAAIAATAAHPAAAGQADVIAAVAHCRGDVCAFDVTVRHADAGWEHYADRFEVVDASGHVLGTRVLRHPHVDEQPFTRRLVGVTVPPELSQVTVRAHDSVHGWGGAEVVVELPAREGAP